MFGFLTLVHSLCLIPYDGKREENCLCTLYPFYIVVDSRQKGHRRAEHVDVTGWLSTK